MSGFPDLRFLGALVRTQGVLTSLGLAVGLSMAAVLVDGTFVSVPGLRDAVPAVRVVPALLAAAGVVLLTVDWRPYEHLGVRSRVLIRATRLTLAVALAVTAAFVVARTTGDPQVLDLTLALVAVQVLAVGVLGELWWVVVPVLLYLQLFRQQVSDLEPPLWVVAVIAVAGSALYLWRNLLPE